jgi:hypothetical protein
MSKNITGTTTLNLTVNNLNFLSITTASITSINGDITNLNSSNINSSTANISDLTLETLNISSLDIENLNASQLNTSNASIDNCSIDILSFNEIDGNEINISTLNASQLNSSNASIDNASIDNLDVLNDINTNTINAITENTSTINTSNIVIRGDGYTTGILDFKNVENNILFGNGLYRISTTDGQGNLNWMNNIDSDNKLIQSDRYALKYNNITTSTIGRMSMAIANKGTVGDTVSNIGGVTLDQDGIFSVVKNPNSTGVGAKMIQMDTQTGNINSQGDLECVNISSTYVYSNSAFIPNITNENISNTELTSNSIDTDEITTDNLYFSNGYGTDLNIAGSINASNLEINQNAIYFNNLDGDSTIENNLNNDNLFFPALNIRGRDNFRQYFIGPTNTSTDTNTNNLGVFVNSGPDPNPEALHIYDYYNKKSIFPNIDVKDIINASSINCSFITADDYDIVNENVSSLNASEINTIQLNASNINSSNLTVENNINLETSTGSIYNNYIYSNQLSIPPIQNNYFRTGMEETPTNYLYVIQNSSTGDEVDLETSIAISNTTGDLFIEKNCYCNNVSITNTSVSNASIDNLDVKFNLNVGGDINLLSVLKLGNIHFETETGDTIFSLGIDNLTTSKLVLQNSSNGTEVGLETALELDRTTGDITIFKDLNVSNNINSQSGTLNINSSTDDLLLELKPDGLDLTDTAIIRMCGRADIGYYNSVMNISSTKQLHIDTSLVSIKPDLNVSSNVSYGGKLYRGIKSYDDWINFRFISTATNFSSTEWGRGWYIPAETNASIYSTVTNPFTYNSTTKTLTLSNTSDLGYYEVEAFCTVENTSTVSNSRNVFMLGIDYLEDTKLSGGSNTEPYFNNSAFNGENPFDSKYCRWERGKQCTLRCKRIVKYDDLSFGSLALSTFSAYETSSLFDDTQKCSIYHAGMKIRWIAPLDNYTITSGTFN